MANDARISTALPIHPKTVKLQRRLGVEAGWFLVRLFLWVADNRYDGGLGGLTTEDIEIAIGWEGELGTFVRALVEVGFLEGGEGAYCVHDWAEHNPWAANRPKRQAASRAANSARWARENLPDTDANRMRTGCDADNSGIPTQPNPTLPNPSPDDGEEAFNYSVNLYPKEKRSHSQNAQALYFQSIGKIRDGELSSSEAVSRMDGAIAAYTAERGKYCVNFERFLCDELWRGYIAAPEQKLTQKEEGELDRELSDANSRGETPNYIEIRDRILAQRGKRARQ